MTDLVASFSVNGRPIGPGQPVYVVAELSANHGGRLERALQLVDAAKAAGADAIKVQTYTADSLTLDSDRDCFRITGGTVWDGRTLHDLYREAAMPWDWQPQLCARAHACGMHFFSSAFDESAVDFLERLHVPVHKIASPELVDLPLIERAARTGKPMILSTGMASLDEIAAAVGAARGAGAAGVALLKCTSDYPADPSEMNLRTIADLMERFAVPVGLSDHTLGSVVPVAAVALGASIVEKHLTLSRDEPGPDRAFSLEPREFSEMVAAIRTAHRALGTASYGPTPRERKSLAFRRSLFVVEDVGAGERLTRDNVRSIRPADGLPPRELPNVLGRTAACDIRRGTPLTWDLIVAGGPIGTIRYEGHD
jgi:pseudaminic acid synthase